MDFLIFGASVLMTGLLGYLVWQGQKAQDWEFVPVQLGSVLAMVVGAIALFASIPLQEGSALQVFLASWSQSAASASGASYPLTSVSIAGVRLDEVLRKIPVGHTPSLYVVHTTLVAFIAGGVSTIFLWLSYAGWSAKKKGVSFLTRLTRLSNIHGDSPARLRALFWSYLWIVFTWIFMIWQKWHILGTDALGQDVMGVFAQSLGKAWAITLFGALCAWAMVGFQKEKIFRIAVSLPMVPIVGCVLSMMQLQSRGNAWLWLIAIVFWFPLLLIFGSWALYRWKKQG